MVDFWQWLTVRYGIFGKSLLVRLTFQHETQDRKETRQQRCIDVTRTRRLLVLILLCMEVIIWWTVHWADGSFCLHSWPWLTQSDTVSYQHYLDCISTDLQLISLLSKTQVMKTTTRIGTKLIIKDKATCLSVNLNYLLIYFLMLKLTIIVASAVLCGKNRHWDDWPGQWDWLKGMQPENKEPQNELKPAWASMLQNRPRQYTSGEPLGCPKL